MGRMFDVLTQADDRHGRNGHDAAPEPPAVIAPAPPALFDPEPADERIPFIEVGGPRPAHAAGRHYRELADALRRQSNGPGPSALLFTATGPTAGTTTIVLNLAVTLAREAGSRVVVVDANLARPGVAGRLSLLPEP